MFSVSLTVGAVEQRLSLKSRKKQKTSATLPSSGKKGRHVVWLQESNYDLVKAGIPIKTEIDAEALYKQEQPLMDESYFYIFKHKNANDMERNAQIPVYEAVYFCSDLNKYIRVQKCHLKRAYQNVQKTNIKKAWHIDPETGVPYWVDRYLCSKLK